MAVRMRFYATQCLCWRFCRNSVSLLLTLVLVSLQKLIMFVGAYMTGAHGIVACTKTLQNSLQPRHSGPGGNPQSSALPNKKGPPGQGGRVVVGRHLKDHL
eukprot:3469578-Amphidinium_carterae.1